MPSLRHQWIVGFIYRALFAYVTRMNLGLVFISPVKVRLWDGKVREPDVCFVSNDSKHNRTDQWFESADLVVEVISPDDPKRDLETKRREYAQAGIPEYWIVDPRSREIMVLTLQDAQYAVHGIFAHSEIATSVLLSGFSVSVDEAFAQP